MVDIVFIVDKIDAELAIDSKINALSGHSLGEFFDEIAVPWFIERAEDRFEGEGDDAVGAWAPLRFPTRAVRKDAGYGATGPINVRTGKLKEYVLDSQGDVRSTGSSASLKWPDATPRGLTGTKVRTAQRGSKTSNTVARPVIAMNETDYQQVTTALTSWIAAAGTHQLAVTT